MIDGILNRIRLGNGKSEFNRILVVFRYASFAVTSLFFLVGGTVHSPARRLFIIGCIGISSVLLSYLYSHYLNSPRLVMPLLLLETVFNTFILIPSGGFNSPYIWYSLNTILVGSIALERKIVCWANLCIYLFGSTWVFSRLMDAQKVFADILQKESNLLLSLVLITGAMQLVTGYSKKIEEKNGLLEKANHELQHANNQINESMNATMELYLAVHLLTGRQSRSNLENIIIEYTLRITKAERVFFYKNRNQQQDILTVSSSSGQDEEKRLKKELSHHLIEMSALNTVGYLRLENRLWLVAPMKCHFENCGAIGIEVLYMPDSKEAEERVKQLTFLSELSTLVLEKFELEQINRKLLINEEQNRIANEIHDGVLQKLFSISCGIFGVSKRLGSANHKKTENELAMILSSLNHAMSDLRSTIYGYSWKKNGTNHFIQDIHSMIGTIRSLHEVEINFELKGNHELLSTDHKTAFYRMISEGIGNALRHGKAGKISIEMLAGAKDITLKITDDGVGFDPEASERADKMGMGIKNIQLLTQSLQGSIKIDSSPGKGTLINITVPVELGTGALKEDMV